MFLTAYNLPHYLLNKGLINAQSVVDGDFLLAEAGRRNRNFKIVRRQHPGLFVKQIKTNEPQATTTIGREAAFYRSVHSDPKYRNLVALIPKFVHFEAQRHALTLNLTENAESMAEHRTRLSGMPESTAALLGNALGIVHSHGPQMQADEKLRSLFACQVPWPLTLDQAPAGFLEYFGAIGTQLKESLKQFPALTPALSALRAEWRFDSLIHGDMKWDNCLISTAADGNPSVTIVDWEMADLADGAWDVATIFKEYIVAAILSANAQQAAAVQNAPPGPAQPIEAMQPSIRAFWKAYANARQLSGPHAYQYLERSVKYTAARMPIAVLEYLSASPQYSTLISAMLQTAMNLLQSTQTAIVQMIGTPVN